MKKKLLSVAFVMLLMALIMPTAKAVSVTINEKTLSDAALYHDTTYVPLRAATEILCPDASINWENGQAIVRTASLTLSAKPGDYYLKANGRMLYASQTVKLMNGRTLVPIRALTKAFGGSVSWNGATQKVTVYRGNGTIASGDSYYNSSDVYWLSRIIHAESNGEGMVGKVAVGNVILNRVASSDFPNNIYDVIFDTAGGVQFSPTSNGAIYNNPSEDSIIAAKLCLDGASVVADSLFFFNPRISASTWFRDNCTLVAVIGSHYFYA